MRLLSSIDPLQTHIKDKYLECPQVNATRSSWLLVNLGAGNDLVPLGNKPLAEQMLTDPFARFETVKLCVKLIAPPVILTDQLIGSFPGDSGMYLGQEWINTFHS